MKPAPLYLGIDFGTTNSSVAFVYGDPRHLKLQSIPVEPCKYAMDQDRHVSIERMPTLVATRFDDRRAKGLLWGWEFFSHFGRRKKSPLLRRGRELFESVKSDLGSHRIYASAQDPQCNTPQKVAAGIFTALLSDLGRKLAGFELDQVRTCITVPASLNAEARRETRAAAVAAGLNGDLIELIDEPVAALLHLLNDQTAAGIISLEEPRNVLVFDYGGGTLDLCLVKCSFNLDAPSGLVAETLSISQYRRNGGNDVDRAIMNQVIWPQIEGQLGRKRSDLSADLRLAVADTLTSTLARKLKERLCVKITRQLEQDGDYSRLRGDLSETVAVDGDFHDERLPRPIRGRFRITKSQFDEVMEPFLRVPSDASVLDDTDFTHSLIAPIWDCLHKASLSPEDLDVLVLHGGSCRNPFVVRHLRKVLIQQGGLFAHTTIVPTPNLDTSVACGAALACYWKHERGVELIKPVTAEDIGIITLGGAPVCLVSSGSPLPFPAAGVHEHPTDFYVAQNGQKELIIPFYAGRTEGKPRLSGSVKVSLPPETLKGDVVRLKLNIDCNKILNWWYRVGAGPFVTAQPFDDPWTPRALDPHERQLVAFRRQLEERLATQLDLPDWMLLEEANRCRFAGQFDEAEVLLLDFMNSRKPTGNSANLLALVKGSQGNTAAELTYAQMATQLDPEDAIILGNYGYMLADAGRVDEAITKIRLALGKNPNLCYLYEKLGDLARRRGDEADARREFQQAIRILEPRSVNAAGDVDVWRDLARIHNKLGDYDQAALARTRSNDAHLNAVYEGDHRHRIAGPDSGFLTSK